MSTLTDKAECLQLGENMNEEYGWSSEIEDLLTQFHFQLTRGASPKLEDKYQEILAKIFAKSNAGSNPKYIIIVYKLIGYTRDIINGKGESQLTYMLISGLYKFSQSPACDPDDKCKLIAMATSALESLVRISNGVHPYGSWKDLKYFCNYHIAENKRSDISLKDPLFTTAINMICGQLQCDEHAPVKSLVAKWIPREKSSKFGWLTPHIATQYYHKWITPNLSPAQHKFAKRKCLTHFRQLVSKINKVINTPQIAQCNGSWSDIDFDKNVSGITLRKQSKAFLGIDKHGNDRAVMNNNEDRQQCSANYKAHVQQCKEGKRVAKGKRVSIVDFVRDAVALTTEQNDSSVERDCLNSQWADNATQNGVLGNCIAMIDTSDSMSQADPDPLYSAIGLGIRIAEKSKLGKRVMTFNSTPTWITLNDCPDFVSMVKKVSGASWGLNANFAAALDMILSTAIENQISPAEMKNMTLVILSDLQIDKNQNNNQNNNQMAENTKTRNTDKQNVMFNIMKTKYEHAGMQSVHREPYMLPHIIFWNLKPTSGFPSLAKTENTSMWSGNNPALLNAFCNKGISVMHDLTPWKFLVRELSNPRYTHLENIVQMLLARP